MYYQVTEDYDEYINTIKAYSSLSTTSLLNLSFVLKLKKAGEYNTPALSVSILLHINISNRNIRWKSIK